MTSTDLVDSIYTKSTNLVGFLRRVGEMDSVAIDSSPNAAHSALHAHTRRVFMQDNLKKKYGITDEELKSAVDQIPFGKIACDGIVLVALVDLISNGDIRPSEEQEQ